MKIGIVGLGLIGGSLGLDLRAQGCEVWGVSRQERTCEKAVVRGAADRAGVDLGLLAAAEVVYVCTPIAAIGPTVAQLREILSPQAIITDVGSVKAEVVAVCEPLWPNFVGGHPMAGTAWQGIEAAEPGLFAGAAYAVTPTEQTPLAAVTQIEALARSLGSRVYRCAPSIHDRAVAWISHLPVMVSAALIAACTAETEVEVRQLAQQLASTGFRDTSRVGGGNPELGTFMARYNREPLLAALAHYRHCLDQMTSATEQGDWSALEQLLALTQQARPQFLPKK